MVEETQGQQNQDIHTEDWRKTEARKTGCRQRSSFTGRIDDTETRSKRTDQQDGINPAIGIGVIVRATNDGMF